jgi:predicted O-methyltransferase YrrM
MSNQEEKFELTAYCVKTKQKNVPIQDAVITKTAKNAFMAQGHDGQGNKLTTLLNSQKALKAIELGVAKQGW